MDTSNIEKYKTLIDREKLMTLNAEGCPACGRKFNLGETVVAACGDWIGPMKLIHENEAIFDSQNGLYVESKCYMARHSAV